MQMILLCKTGHCLGLIHLTNRVNESLPYQVFSLFSLIYFYDKFQQPFDHQHN